MSEIWVEIWIKFQINWYLVFDLDFETTPVSIDSKPLIIFTQKIKPNILSVLRKIISNDNWIEDSAKDRES